MQVDWELSESLTSDGEGIRAVGAPPVAGILIGGGGDNNNNNVSMDNDNNNTQQQQQQDSSFSILTGTQGGAIYSFDVPNSGNIHGLTHFQHDHSVTAILVGRHVCVTGCKDGIVRLYRYNNNNDNINSNSNNSKDNIILLKGHAKAVTSLAWASLENDEDNKEAQEDADFIVSGSWDGTAKVWKITDATSEKDCVCIATLPGHENSVCVAFLPPPPQSGSKYLNIATGSAGVAQNNAIRDHAVRLWQVDATSTTTHNGDNVKLIQTCANDHDGPIRDILCLSFSSSTSSSSSKSQYHQMLATCSNDGTVKLRSADTLQATSTLTFLQQQQEHPPMLLSLCFVQDCLIASAEDGNVIAWDLQLHGSSDISSSSTTTTATTVGEPQLIRHATTVWQVRALPNNDFVSASDDGMLRIFTRAQDRMASVEQRQAFRVQVQEALEKLVQTSQGGPSSEEVAKLPHWQDNTRKQGTSEGQVQLFQKDGIAIAAQWSTASASWIEVGQVTGSRDTGTIDGVTYDHVLPIEIDNTQTAAAAGNAGGVATLQLGYNNGENPFTAAQRFIDAHMLPQHYLSQIADYIQQRLGQAAAGAPTLGGGSGGAQRPSAATTGVPIAAYQHLPIQAMQLFELPAKSAATTLDKMKSKIQAFEILNPEEMVQVEKLWHTLLQQQGTTTIPHEQCAIISTMLTKFAPNQAFPALDLARIVALHAGCSSSSSTAMTDDDDELARQVSYWDQVIQQSITLCKEASLAATADPAADNGPAAPAVAIPMLSLRLFCNLFAAAAANNRGEGKNAAQQVVAMHVSSMLEIARAHIKSPNKNIRLSIATLLHNVCYYLYLQKSTSTSTAVDMDTSTTNMETLTLLPEIMPLLGEIISSCYKVYEEPALLRIFQALGTWIMAESNGGGTNNNEVKAAANALYLAAKVEMAASHHSAACKTAAKEVYSVLQS